MILSQLPPQPEQRTEQQSVEQQSPQPEPHIDTEPSDDKQQDSQASDDPLCEADVAAQLDARVEPGVRHIHDKIGKHVEHPGEERVAQNGGGVGIAHCVYRPRPQPRPLPDCFGQH